LICLFIYVLVYWIVYVFIYFLIDLFIYLFIYLSNWLIEWLIDCLIGWLQALATACVSCGPDQPADTKLATARVVDQLMLLVNPENDLDHVGTTGPVCW